MKLDFRYADLQVRVTVKPENDSVFGQLTDKETLLLRQALYIDLVNFLFIRVPCLQVKLNELAVTKIAEHLAEIKKQGG